MHHDFDEQYWNTHWRDAARDQPTAPNPYLVETVATLPPGTALDAGCGEGTEAAWLASRGWSVTGADISTEALARARARTPEGVTWIAADLETWQPHGRFDLVATHYAHPAGSQLAFYDRVARWVAPGGTLLIVGHRTAEVTGTSVSALFDRAEWEVTAVERTRELHSGSAHPVALDDVVVSAVRYRVGR